MAMTRAQAQSLLNQSEMSLYDNSRINGLRSLGATELARRVERARKARDRARDLLQRQRLASRERTGSKRGSSGVANQRSKVKATLLADILKRFEAHLKLVQKQEKNAKVAAGKRAGKTAPAKAAKATRKAVAKKAAPAKQAAARMPAVVAVAGPKTAPASAIRGVRKPATAAGKTRKRATRKITPEQALANTYQLLEARKEQAHEARPWHTLDPGHHVPEAGFQSPQAASKALELHAGESRMASIQGSISTRDRRNQGKRDNRGSGSEA